MHPVAEKPYGARHRGRLLAADLIDSGEIMPITTDQGQIMNRISMMRIQGKPVLVLEKIFLEHFHEHIRQQKWTRRVNWHWVQEGS